MQKYIKIRFLQYLHLYRFFYEIIYFHFFPPFNHPIHPNQLHFLIVASSIDSVAFCPELLEFDR